MGQDRVSFDCTTAERGVVRHIGARAAKLAKRDGFKLDRLLTEMDVMATHANGCPLDLARLLAADDFNFCHDVFGIARHLDRETGALTDWFLPRFASKSAASEAEPA